MLIKVIFDKMWLFYIYCVITLFTTIEAIFKSSFFVGATALVACALSYFGTATFVASFHARRAKNYTLKQLIGIAVIAVALSATGIALITWSGFWIGFFGVAIKGQYWALIGIVIAALTTKKEHAL